MPIPAPRRCQATARVSWPVPTSIMPYTHTRTTSMPTSCHRYRLPRGPCGRCRWSLTMIFRNLMRHHETRPLVLPIPLFAFTSRRQRYLKKTTWPVSPTSKLVPPAIALATTATRAMAAAHHASLPVTSISTSRVPLALPRPTKLWATRPCLIGTASAAPPTTRIGPVSIICLGVARPMACYL